QVKFSCIEVSMNFSSRRNRKVFLRRRLSCILLIFFGTVAITRANAQAPAAAVAAQPSSHTEAREHARAIAKDWLARGIPGLNVAVAINGKIVYSEGFGYADLEGRVPAWPTTKFRIGSVSKPLTSAALMRLFEQGKIDLDAPIQKYVSSFPEKGAT